MTRLSLLGVSEFTGLIIEEIAVYLSLVKLALIFGLMDLSIWMLGYLLCLL